MRATLKAVRSKCGASVVPSSDIAIRRRSCAVDMRSSLRLCDHTVLGRERATAFGGPRQARPQRSIDGASQPPQAGTDFPCSGRPIAGKVELSTCPASTGALAADAAITLGLCQLLPHEP